MCPQVGYEADTGVEVPPTGLTPVDERRVECVVFSSLSCLAFFFGDVGTLKLRVKGGHLCGSYFARLVCQMLRFPSL